MPWSRIRTVLGVLLFLLLVPVVWAVQYWYLTIGTWELWEAPAYSHYVWLSHGLLLGRLDIVPSDLAIQAPLEELAQVPDPYEPGERQRWNVPFDVSYYQGKFYLYFGVVPAILLA